MHAVFLNSVYPEDEGGEVEFHALPRLETEEVGGALEDAARRITRYLRKRGLFAEDGDEDGGALSAPESEEPRTKVFCDDRARFAHEFESRVPLRT